MTGRDPLTLAVTGMLPLVLITAAAIALPVSLFLLWLYRRSVLRSMRVRTTPPGAVEPEGTASLGAPSSATSAARPTVLRIEAVDGASAVRVGPRAAALLREARRAPWRTAAVYALGGLAYAVVMATAFQLTSDGTIRPVRSALLVWTYAWPVVLVVRLVAGSGRRTRIAAVGVYFAVLLGFFALAVVLSPAVSLGQLLFLWADMNVPPTLLMLAFLNRRVRAVGPLVIAFMILAILGANLALSAAEPEDRLRRIVDIGSALGLEAYGMLLGILLVGAAFFAVLAGLGLLWIRRRYEAGKISDQSLTIDALWLVFGVVESTNLVFSGARWLLACPAALVAYKLVCLAGFSVTARRATTEPPPILLLLRVFSLGHRSERLFDALATHWRHVGLVRLIAGPDLATTTVEPHEFLDFVSGRLGRRFIDGPAALERRIAETRSHPDRDGRFRVGEFFCHDDTWHVVLARLAGEADAVMMDLRGFSTANAGCIFEVQSLVNVVPVPRVALVYDDTTDRRFLDETLDRAWAALRADSPNRAAAEGALRLVRYDGPRAFPSLLRSLCAAASAT